MAEPTDRAAGWLSLLAPPWVRRSRGAEPSAAHPGTHAGPGGGRRCPLTPACQRRDRRPRALGRFQPPPPSLPHGAKPTPPAHTQTLPSAPRPRHTHTTSAAASSGALTPPCPRCPFPRGGGTGRRQQRRWRRRRGFRSRPGRAAAAAGTGGGRHEPQGSSSRPREGQRRRPPLPKWRRLPLPPHPARGAARGGSGRGLPHTPGPARPGPAGRARGSGVAVGFRLLYPPAGAALSASAGLLWVAFWSL